MIVAGDHANNDMAGDEDGSWKKEFEKAGYDVTCLVRWLRRVRADPAAVYRACAGSYRQPEVIKIV